MDDYEANLDALRIFAREGRKRIQERDLRGELPLTELFSELSSLAEAVLLGSLQTVWREISSDAPSGDFAIIAMGKLGGRELTYRSDLDLIYIYEDPADQEFYTRLGTRLISALSVLTRQGIAYAVDTALRPSGNRGTLVSSLASFREYHDTLGQTWERQALTKARPLFGRPDRGKEFVARVGRELESISYQDYDPAVIAAEIDRLRGRMEREIAREKPGRFNLKTGHGGLVDVEFSVQYLQLVHGRRHPNIRNPNTILALRALVEEGHLEPPLAAVLETAYLFLREIETRLRLLLDWPADELIEGADWLGELQSRYFKGADLIPRLIDTRERVRSVYEKVLRL